MTVPQFAPLAKLIRCGPVSGAEFVLVLKLAALAAGAGVGVGVAGAAFEPLPAAAFGPADEQAPAKADAAIVKMISNFFISC